MALSAEHILTLQQLKGIGNSTILKIAESINKNISSIEALCNLWKSLKGKKFEEITTNDIIRANHIAKDIIKRSAKESIGLISYYDDAFPSNLRNTVDEKGKLAPPILLWYKGDISIINNHGIAIIGSRNTTKEGIIGGTFISKEFAKRDFNIISGLALGADTSAHIGALNVNGRTIAILANGLDSESIYPAENRKLSDEIVNNGGLLLSEYKIGEKANKFTLVARDRLQAGLANATIVIQTKINGGSMHASKATLIAGKPLYAMKYKDDSTNNNENCLGNAHLVTLGAKYISGNDNLDDISNYIRERLSFNNFINF